jgi:hypothetical protein
MAGVIVVALGLMQLLDRWRRLPGDRLRRQLERSLRPLRHLGLEPLPGESLEAFCARVGERHPSLMTPLTELIHSYQLKRFAMASTHPQGRSIRSLGGRLAHRIRRLPLGSVEMIQPALEQ